MALSNIFKEPRREIIETALGLLILIPFGLIFWPLYEFCISPDGGVPVAFAIMMATALSAAGTMLLIGAAIFIHSIGEGICKSLRAGGYDPRPNRRN